MGGPTAGEQPGELGHEADVGQLGRGETMPASGPRAILVDPRYGPKLPIGVPRPSRLARRAGGETDTDRTVVVRCRFVLLQALGPTSEATDERLGRLPERDRLDPVVVNQPIR